MTNILEAIVNIANNPVVAIRNQCIWHIIIQITSK